MKNKQSLMLLSRNWFYHISRWSVNLFDLNEARGWLQCIMVLIWVHSEDQLSLENKYTPWIGYYVNYNKKEVHSIQYFYLSICF